MKIISTIGMLLLWVTGPVLACDPMIPDFPGVVSRQQEVIVVVGHYIADPDASPDDGPNTHLFLVEEVLKGELSPGPYHLMMPGPWGSRCEIFSVPMKRPPESGVRRLMLVSQVNEGRVLEVPFMEVDEKIVDGKVLSKQIHSLTSYPRKFLEELPQPLSIEIDLEAFKRWLAQGRPGPLPIQKQFPIRQ